MQNIKVIKYLKKGDNKPQLIPAFGKPERKLLSVFMALMDIVPKFRGEILKLCGYNSGRTCNFSCYMEPQFESPNLPNHRPEMD